MTFVLRLPALRSKFLCSEFLLEDLLVLLFRSSSKLVILIWMAQIRDSMVSVVAIRTPPQMSLVKPPELLIIHLERFTQIGSGNFIKNSLGVACDRSISLTEKTYEPCTIQNYCLFSVIEHTGTSWNGHYTCHVQEPRSRQWYFCNDSFVEKSDIV